MIKQRTLVDCVICTVAMALDVPYEQVLAAATPDAITDQGVRFEYVILERFGMKQMRDFRVLHRPQLMDAGYFLHFSWGRRAILSVPSLNREDCLHSVWYDHRVYDSSNGSQYSPDSWPQLKPEQIILFAER